ncbi:MAG: adenylyltransferase/cytidyltransferase family protein [Clostridiales bacterium]|nr:adenylyltransferase/cytidyltransferase family protein [Clostridiales bacterium]
MDSVGVIHGRFQMLHKGHMEYLLAGKKRCKYLIIGIANPDISLTNYSDAAPHRSMPLANPLTYYERFQMIRGSMLENGISLQEFDIVPFPINYPDLLRNYVPMDARFYMTIYDQWGIRKKRFWKNWDVM